MSTVTSYQGSYLGDIDDSFLIATFKSFVEIGSSISIIPSSILTQDLNIDNSLQIAVIFAGIGSLVLLLFYIFCLVAKSLSCTISPKISPGHRQIDIAIKYASNYKLGKIMTYSFAFMAMLMNQLLLLLIIPIISPASPLIINGVNNVVTPLAYLTSLFDSLKSSAVTMYQYSVSITKLSATAETSCETFQKAVAQQLLGFKNATSTLKTETASFYSDAKGVNTTANQYLNVILAYLLVLALYILPLLCVASVVYGVKRSHSTLTNCAVNFSAVIYLATTALCVGFFVIAGALVTACDGDAFENVFLYLGATQEKINSMQTYFECSRGDVPAAFSTSIDDVRTSISSVVAVCDSYLRVGYCPADVSITSIRSSLVGSVNTTINAFEGLFSCTALKSSAYTAPIQIGLCVDMTRTFLLLWFCQQSMAMFFFFMLMSATFACQYFDHAREVFPGDFEQKGNDGADGETSSKEKPATIADLMKTIDDIAEQKKKRRGQRGSGACGSESDDSLAESKASTDEEQGGAGISRMDDGAASAQSSLTRIVPRGSGKTSFTSARRASDAVEAPAARDSGDEAEIVSVRSAVSVRSFRSARSVNTDNVNL